MNKQLQPTFDINVRAAYLLSSEFFKASEGFSGENHGYFNMTCPHDTQAVLRMLVRYRGGELLLPDELEWVRPFIEFTDGFMP